MWASGRSLFGAWCSLESSFSAEIAARSGFDYVCIDMQHGLSDFSSLLPALQAVYAGGSLELVRVPENQPWMIMKSLDLGARGVIVPLIDFPEMAAKAAAAVRYPPGGRRSYGPTRAGVVLDDPSPDVHGRAACIVMIESQDALRSVVEIARVPGVDALYIGPADLSLSLDLPLPGREPNPTFEEAAATVLEAAVNAGIYAGIHCTDAATARRRQAQGFHMINVVSDVQLLRRGFASELSLAQDEHKPR
ncbi:MAG: aldolase [Acidimicrobiia bacterium]|nr:aldolase [Acidimicrobiia bacterium]